MAIERSDKARFMAHLGLLYLAIALSTKRDRTFKINPTIQNHLLVRSDSQLSPKCFLHWACSVFWLGSSRM
ncbi:MAG: hypothetical protein MUC48_09295 [Leptolyngbya sp. Prado105]|nr:hypothetical protein [Leptolyngbya sp. Prado105]